jgi:hypothetical protein
MEDVEVLSQQMGDLASPSKSPAPKKQKKGGDGESSSKAIEITDTKAAKQPIEEAKLKSPEKRIDSQESSVVEMSQS